MTSPGWLADILAAVVLVVALFSSGRLIAARGRRRRGEADADGMHVVMGVAMAGMFVPRLATLPDAAWGVVFGLGAVWFAGRAWRDRGGRDQGRRDRGGRDRGGRGSGGRDPLAGHELAGRWCAYPVPHLVDCVAMVYVLWAVPAAIAGGRAGAGGGMGAGGMGAMGGAGGTHWPVLGLGLAVAVCGYVVWLLDRLPALRAVSAAPAGVAVLDRDRLSAGFSGQPVTIMTSGAPRALLAPRAATWCKIAMGVAMGVMLIGIL
ncbi:MAG TPA: DUF5134 domain-containing protein [Streptosporangiaceae bacterium]|nr:DUF5134 domain-containing protein [Streptosporangiaceae bacterium]